ncbi:MAG: hypothetical protein JWM91_5264 [Rhodospirillales bacterium]|nr:hypothetical protein [Rhodospirillales bacterium]
MLCRFACLIGIAAMTAAVTGETQAGPFDALEFHWDNTVDLSTQYGLHNASSATSGYCALYEPQNQILPAADDHSCGYGAGFRSARIDLLSQIDVAYRNFGLHVSAAAWYDAIDNSDNISNEGGTLRTADISENGGHDIELFEAFLHGTIETGGDRSLSFRVGRHSVIWGESLFFPSNGVAAGQAPIDSYIVQSVGDYHGKNVYLPVNQMSFSWAVADNLSIQAYYQFEWRRSRIDPQYAYVDPNNVLGAEGTHLIQLTVPRLGTFYYNRTPDRLPSSTDQYGVALKFHRGDFDFGLYALSYDSKTPNIYYDPNTSSTSALFAPGAYSLEFARGIEIYGASVAAPLGNAAVAAEISGRRNMPLVNGGIFLRPGPGVQPAFVGRPLYPLGDTIHAQFSWLYTVPPLPGLPDGASWRGEVAANHLLETTANPNALAPGRTRTAAALRMVFEPQFFQLLPRIDVTVPVGVGYNFLGLSQTDPAMNRGTGDVNIGITATVDGVWKGSLTLTHYFGNAKYSIVGFGGPQQSLENRDLIELSIERSF